MSGYRERIYPHLESLPENPKAHCRDSGTRSCHWQRVMFWGSVLEAGVNFPHRFGKSTENLRAGTE